MAEIISAVRVVGRRTERLEYLLVDDKARTRKSLPLSQESLDKVIPLFTETTTFQILNKKTGRRYTVSRQDWLSLPASDLIEVGKRGA